MNPGVDQYLEIGCGRCSYWKTPQCKVHTWHKELVELRRIVLDTDLVEEIKWSMPCYTSKGKNIVMVSAFKDYCFISFFKGSLIQDNAGILEAVGENSHVAKVIKFTNVKDIKKHELTIKQYIDEAIRLEHSEIKPKIKPAAPMPIPIELEAVFKKNKTFKEAFYKLTPGRQRGYLLYYGQAKQSATKTSRIEKSIPNIMMGKGWNE